MYNRFLIACVCIILLTMTACGGQQSEPLPTLAQIDDQTTDTTETNSEAPVEDTSSGEDNASDNNAASANVSVDDLAPATGDFSITGAITSDGTYSGEEPAISYEPFNSPNFAGQHELEILADVAPTDLSEETTIEILVRFPADIAPGTYQIHERDRDTPELVQASATFGVASFSFDDNVNGSLEIAEIGEQITAAFNFTVDAELFDSDEVLTIEVTGRVNQIPFSYRPETTLNLSGLVSQEFSRLTAFEDDTQTYSTQYNFDDFSSEYRWDINYRHTDFEYMAEVIFFLASDIQPGTYDVAYAPPENQRVPEGLQVGARLSYEDTISGLEFRADTITGTITIEINENNYASNTYEIVGTDSESGETLTATGTFSYYESIFGTGGE